MRTVRRRTLLRAGALATAALSVQGCVSQQLCDGQRRTATPALWIDAHAHVFNAADLPVEGFIRDVILDADERRTRRLVLPIAWAVVRGVKRRAPSYADEVVHLRAALAGDDDAVAELLRPPATADQLRAWADEECRRDPALGRAVDAAARQEGLRDRRAAYRLTPIGRLVDWLRLFSAYRCRNVQTLLDLYPAVEVFCPALVDFETPLGPDADPGNRARTATMAQQIELMELIARLRPGRLLPFVAFDPFRFAASDAAARTRYLAEVRDAVESRGFVGVKMYPAMGFYPLGNAALLPPREQRLGQALDAALRALYDWCASTEGDVPILAHCKNSRGRRAGDAERGHPDAWRAVLEEPPYAHLRVNLGHFGGDEDLLENGRASWAWAAAALMGGYQGVYADVGNDELLVRGGRKARAYVDRLRELHAAHPVPRSRVMYGSDWLFVALARGFGKHHASNAEAYERCLPDAASGFLGDNARRFLGLHPGARTHTRLTNWYARHGLVRPAWLA